jgi:hypothetical protein
MSRREKACDRMTPEVICPRVEGFYLRRPSMKPRKRLSIHRAAGGRDRKRSDQPQSGKPMPNPWKPYWSPDDSQIIFTGISWEHETWMMRDFLRAR